MLLPLPRSAAGPSLTPGSVVRALERYYAPLRLPLGGSRPAQEGLSSSVHDSPCIPRPLRRGVLGGCVSQVFPTSMGLRLLGPGSAPPCPLHSEEYNGAADFALCCGLQVCSASFRGLCQRALTPASRPAQAGAWDFVTAQLLGGWGLPETGLSPVSHARLIWTHSQAHLALTNRPGIEASADETGVQFPGGGGSVTVIETLSASDETGERGDFEDGAEW